MHYVKHFNFNGVNTKQIACIELQGVPNTATEGAVGVLGIDMTSPTKDVYKCVAVNGSLYTWELLSMPTDSELSKESTRPVQNKVVTTEIESIKESIKNSGGSGGSITVDNVLSEASTNPVQNKVITAEINSLKESINGIEEELQMINEGGVE